MKALVQFYSINKLVIDGQEVVFNMPGTPNLACQMLPLSHQVALLLLTNADRAMDGLMAWDGHCPSGNLSRVEYSIVGTPDGRRVGMQHYHHDFTTPVEVEASDIGATITATRGALFIPYQLDVLLDTKVFGKVQSVQFIA